MHRTATSGYRGEREWEFGRERNWRLEGKGKKGGMSNDKKDPIRQLDLAITVRNDKKDPIRQLDLAITDLTHSLPGVLYPDTRVPLRPR